MAMLCLGRALAFVRLLVIQRRGGKSTLLLLPHLLPFAGFTQIEVASPNQGLFVGLVGAYLPAVLPALL